MRHVPVSVGAAGEAPEKLPTVQGEARHRAARHDGMTPEDQPMHTQTSAADQAEFLRKRLRQMAMDRPETPAGWRAQQRGDGRTARGAAEAGVGLMTPALKAQWIAALRSGQYK